MVLNRNFGQNYPNFSICPTKSRLYFVEHVCGDGRDANDGRIRIVMIDEFERVKKMMADNAATQKQYDDMEGQIQILERQINNSRAQYANIEADKTNLDSKVKELDDQLKRSILTSPISGVVLEKYVEQGELTNAGKAVIKVANLKEMILRAYISGNQLPHVKIGQKVKVIIDNDSKTNSELEGTISWISSTSEFTPKIIQTKEERVNLVYAIKVMVPNSGEIKIGMPGEVKF